MYSTVVVDIWNFVHTVWVIFVSAPAGFTFVGATVFDVECETAEHGKISQTLLVDLLSL